MGPNPSPSPRPNPNPNPSPTPNPNPTQGLDLATRAFVEADLRVEPGEGAARVTLSKILDWYGADFGADEAAVLGPLRLPASGLGLGFTLPLPLPLPRIRTPTPTRCSVGCRASCPRRARSTPRWQRRCAGRRPSCRSRTESTTGEGTTPRLTSSWDDLRTRES